MEIEVHIAPSAVMRHAADLQQQCIAALSKEGDINVDLSAVEEADLSLPQLLTALRVSAAEAGRVVRLRSPAPAAVAALLDRAGFLAAPTAQDLEFWFHGERAQ